jgi:hypothetical protein
VIAGLPRLARPAQPERSALYARFAGPLRRRLASAPGQAAAVAMISPAVHLLLSVLVERRRVDRTTEYPAVVVGDPLLAVATGLATGVCGPERLAASRLRQRPIAPVTAAAMCAFGAWQARDEVRRGVFTRRQALSPTKLWHQFVVYPSLAILTPSALFAATTEALKPTATHRQRAATAAAWGCVACWAALTVEAIHRPRAAHGSFDWSAWLRNRPRGCRHV